MSQTNQTRVALITGGAIRVGRAIALGLADAGFDVAVTYLKNAQPARELAAEIEGKSRRCIAIHADLVDPVAGVEAINAQLTASFQRLDVLVNNASLYERDNPGDASQARRLWAIHVESPLLLCRRFAPMLKTAGGAVVNMVDLQAERPTPGYLAYCASKAGLWNLTLGLARELAPRVRVNGIAPGVVEWEVDLPLEKREEYLRRVPLARAGTPVDVANAVKFLCAGENYVTGQILRLDGGRSIT
jgi:pteridine reductase